MKLSTIQKAFIAIIIANLIWGAAASIFKIALTNIPAFTLAFWRFFLGAVLILMFLKGKTAISFQSPKQKFAIAGYAMSGITFNILFFFWGLQLTHSINAPIIASGAPIVTFILAALFLKERATAKKIIGILLGTLGILTIVFQPLLEHGVDGSVTGNLLITMATIGAVVQTIIHRRFLLRLDPLKVTFWAFVVGSASFLPLALFDYVQRPDLYQLLDWRGFMGIGFGAVLSSAVAYSLYAFALTKITATDSSLFTYLDPIVGTAMGAILLKEPVTAYFILGCILIFGGILLAEGRLPHYPIGKLRRVREVQEEIEEYISRANKREVLKNIFGK